MTPAGIHPDTDFPLSGADGPADAPERRTVAAVAARIDELCDELESLTAEVATLVRDGGDDVRPGWSAREAMLAAGRLMHSAEAIGAISFLQADVTGCSTDDGLRDTGTWAQRHTGVSAGTTSMMRRVGRCLERYPVLGQAFVEGRIRAHHLVAVDKVIPSRFDFEQRHAAMAIIGDIQIELVTIAQQSTQREFERFCQQIRDRVDTDGPQPADGDGRSEIHLRQLPSGRWTLLGDLSAGDGALIATLLAERVAQQMRTNTAGDQPKTKPEHDELAGNDNDNENDNDSGDETGAPPPDQAVRMGDALRSLLRDGAGARRPGRVGVFLHLDLDDLAAMGADITAHTEANLDISGDTLWGLLAGADITPIITESGTPLSYGRTERLAPDMLRHALAFRDQTCWFPGCDRPPIWHRIHHCDWWDHGGTTDPVVCKGGCSEHHHLHHDQGWGVSPPDGGAPGKADITRPDGTAFDPTPRWQQRHHARDPYRRRTLARLDALTSNT